MSSLALIYTFYTDAPQGFSSKYKLSSSCTMDIAHSHEIALWRASHSHPHSSSQPCSKLLAHLTHLDILRLPFFHLAQIFSL